MSRIFDAQFKEKLLSNKIIWIEGPIGSGKSTYISKILNQENRSFELIDFKSKDVRSKFNSLNENELSWYFSNSNVYILKDAQYLKELQFLVDLVLNQKVGATLLLTTAFNSGLKDELKTAIKWEGLYFYFAPKTYYEWTQENGMVYEEKNLENRLIFGNLFSNFNEVKEFFIERLNSHLEQILEHQLGSFDRINKRKLLWRLLQLLALKIGESISYNELADQIGLDNETVERYIELFQSAHILIVIPTLYNENRYEVKKQQTIFFIDNGIRNTLAQNFSSIEDRFDQEILWKNWLIAERFKWLKTIGKEPKFYFWKSHTRQMVDLIEVEENLTFAMRCTWNKKKKLKISPLFESYYPKVIFKSLNRTTYLGFLTRK